MSIQNDKLLNLQDAKALYDDLRERDSAVKQAKADIITVSDTESSAIKTFPDGADNQPMAVQIAIEPVQDLHGQEYPFPPGSTANKWDEVKEYGYYDVTTGEPVDSSGYYRSVNFCECLPNTEYYGKASGNPSSFVVLFYDASKNYVGYLGTAITRNKTFTTLENAYFFKIYFSASAASGISINYPATVTDYVPYSNICPISGWTGANVYRGGSNLISYILTDRGLQTSGTIATYSNRDMYYAPIVAGKTYVVDFAQIGFFYEITDNQTYDKMRHITEKKYTKFTAPITGYVAAVVYHSVLESGRIPIIAEGDEYEITFPTEAGTVYGGTLTVNKDGSADLISSMAMVDLGTLTWSPNDNLYFATMQDMKPYTTGESLVGKLLCTALKPRATAESVTSLKDNMANLEIGKRSNYLYIYVRYDGMETASELQTALSGVIIAYELAQPVTYHFTAEQIKTLLGLNNLWADTGDILSVDYSADTKLYVDQVTDKLTAAQRLMELIITTNREDGMKATKAYSQGNMMIVNGALYKATTSIANGATLTVDTNITATTVAEELAALA